MDKLQITEINAETGEVRVRDLTAEEIKQHNKDLQEKEERKQATALKSAQKAELLAKLGISEEEAKLLLA